MARSIRTDRAPAHMRFISRTLVSQMSRPRGVLTEPLARIFNRLDHHINAAAVDALAVRPGQTVLDMGFGGGVGINLVMGELERQGKVIGVDVATDLTRRATRIYADQIAAGHVEIFEASAVDIPVPSGSVDRCLSVGSYYHWGDIPAGVREISRVLRPGGRVVIAVLPSAIARHKRYLPETPVPPDIGELVELFQLAGIDQSQIRSVGRDVVLAIGQNSD